MDLSNSNTSLSDMLRRARETLSKYTPHFGNNSVVAGAVDPMTSNPLYAALMGSAQGDVLNNHVPRMYGPSGPAVPTPQVQSAPLQPADSGVSPPISGPQTPTPPQGNNIPWWANAQGANFGPSNVPMPQPRPAQAPQPTPMPQPRPAQAPQPQASPIMNFFQRNTALMKDPATGDYIDPRAAAVALAQMNNKS